MQVLLSPERLRPVEHMPAIVDLLSYILQRDVEQRPTTSDIITRLLLLYLGHQPAHVCVCVSACVCGCVCVGGCVCACMGVSVLQQTHLV